MVLKDPLPKYQPYRMDLEDQLSKLKKISIWLPGFIGGWILFGDVHRTGKNKSDLSRL